MAEGSITEHFKQFFILQKADSKILKDAVYKIRYDVYCDEFQYENNCQKDYETDQFDDYSQHILIKHIPSNRFAGCSRLVVPPFHNHSLLFPFENCCLSSIDLEKFKLLEKDRDTHMGEISRLAVHRDFRRRAGESSNPHGVEMDHAPLNISPQELRLFPFIAVSLYLASAAIALDHGLKYVVVMMEPRLARLMSRFGICFSQIGNIMDYHGKRAIFYIDKKMLFDNLKPELQELFDFVSEQIKK